MKISYQLLRSNVFKFPGAKNCDYFTFKMDNSGPDIVFDINVEEKSNTVSMSSIISRTPA